MRQAIHHGPSLRWLESLDDQAAAGVVTDPPYSSGGAFRGDRAASKTNAKYINSEYVSRYPIEFSGDSRDQRSWTWWCHRWLSECWRVTANGGVLACFVDWRQLPALTDAVQMAGWVWRGVAVWDKTEGCRPALGRFASQCEYIVWGSKGPMPTDREIGGAGRTLPGVFRCSVSRGKEHPTEKPIDMLRQVVRLVEPGGLILDPFVGSGAIGQAAITEGYEFAGAELVDEYAAMAAARIKGTQAERRARPLLPFDGAEQMELDS